MNEKKSPIKAPLLRYPAQSLDEEIESVLENETREYILFPLLMGMLAVLEWGRWLFDVVVHPVSLTIGFLGVALFSFFKVRKASSKLKLLRQGRDGERAVGQFLETLTDKKCRIFHDVVVDGFNIDHVMVSSKGVFAIETKTYSKPKKGSAVIKYVGDTLIINDERSSKDELIQAKAAANWLKHFFKETLDRRLEVKPVLLFPGWYIENGSRDDVWVLEPKAFAKFYENRDVVWDKDEVLKLSTALSRFIRDSAKFG